MSKQRTKEQQKAIDARGNVLVSASAGAGKTSVMITRLAQILEDGADLSEVLAVTFTKKAAAEMKSRLHAELIERLKVAKDAKRENIRRQLNNINTADISTIHSFCARLVRKYFFAVDAEYGVDASFEILADTTEEAALKQRAIDELFEQMYKEKDKDFYLILSCLRKKRNDESIKKLVFEQYAKVRIQPRYTEFLKSDSIYTPQGFEKISGEYHKVINDRCKLLIDEIDTFKNNFSISENEEGYLTVLKEIKTSLSKFISSGSIYAPPAKLAESNKPDKPKDCKALAADEKFANFVEKIKYRFKTFFKYIGSEEEEREHFLACRPLAEAVAGLLLKFDKRYAKLKSEEGKLDYGDLEQYAYNLLCGDGCDEDVKQHIRSTYKYVFIDEYQDVNPIQDEIISAVAANDLFCVGDIKQAIYGFRGSRSEFFIRKGESIGDGDSYIVLPDNFRSSKAVINFVNDLFKTMMRDPFTQFDYEAGEHAMREGKPAPEKYGGQALICKFNGASREKVSAQKVYSVEDDVPTGKAKTAESDAVMQLIDWLLCNKYYDAKTNEEKPITPGDICVLTRKRSNKNALAIINAISSRYPVAGAAESNVCDRPEIKSLLNLLSYVNNTKQDIPLVSAMLTPVGGFGEEELAAIRAYGYTVGERLSFGECKGLYAQNLNDTISQKIKVFDARISELRALSQFIGAGALIDRIMLIGGFAAKFNSKNKLCALRTLQQEAYTPSGEISLASLLYKIKRSGNKIIAPSSLSSDCVKVMTMHASKGLEFPVVIVADICVTFKGDDKTEIYSGKYGFAPRYYDAENRKSATTVLRQLYKLKENEEELKNEINLFYVACTRAKYALYVLAGNVKEYNGVSAFYAENYAALFDVKAFNPVDTNAVGEVDYLNKMNRVAAFEYAHSLAKELPVKSSATTLVQQNDVNKSGGYGGGERGSDESLNEGKAYHRFLEVADLSAVEEGAIKKQLAELEEKKLITEEQLSLLNIDNLIRILSLPEIRAAASARIFREREFVCRLSAGDYLNIQRRDGQLCEIDSDDNGVIVQGAIDLLSVVEKEGKVVSAHITDYKYSTHTDDALREKYAPQLALYKSVVCSIYGLPPQNVSASILNIRTCRLVQMQV